MDTIIKNEDAVLLAMRKSTKDQPLSFIYIEYSPSIKEYYIQINDTMVYKNLNAGATLIEFMKYVL
jgi:hypothetical protein